MFIVTFVILMALLWLGVLYQNSSKQERSRCALDDDLGLTRRLLSYNHESRNPSPSRRLHIIKTVEHDARGLLHIIELRSPRTGLIARDLSLTLGPPQHASSQTFNGKLFNGVNTLTLTFHGQHPIEWPLEEGLPMFLRTPELSTFHDVHDLLRLRTLHIDHEGITLIAELPQSLLTQLQNDDARTRQTFLAQHITDLFDILDHTTADRVLLSWQRILLNLFTGEPGFTQPHSDRTQLIELLLDERQHIQSIRARTWQALFSHNQPLELLFALSHFTDEMLEQMSEAQLTELVRRVHVPFGKILTPIIPGVLSHLPLELLADETIDFEFKFVLLTAWLQDPHTDPHVLQPAIRAMIMAHPFERQRIQGHITSTPGVQHGSLSLSHGLPNGNISIVPAKEPQLPE